MKLTLMIEGSPAVIAAVLAVLPGGATVVSDQQELPLADPMYLQQTGRGTRDVTIIIPTIDDGAPECFEVISAVDTGVPLLDSAGVAWDARIHAISKGTVANGTWRMKRNVDPTVVAELASSTPIIAPDTPPMPIMPTALADHAVQPMPVEPAVTPAPMPVVEVQSEPITMVEFMQRLSLQMTGPDAKITNEYLTEVIGKFNAAYGTAFITVGDFFTSPDKLPSLVQMIALDGRW
jgi:hypothetical protein